MRLSLSRDPHVGGQSRQEHRALLVVIDAGRAGTLKSSGAPILCTVARMARVRVTRDHWSVLGLAVLAVATFLLVFLVFQEHRTPPSQAASTPVMTPPTPSASASSASATPSATARAGLAGIADIIDSPDGASILVIGDGSGNQNDEWV